MQNCITGIQQIGIGVSDADAAAQHYKALFGMDTLVFDDRAEASLMTRYTGGKVHSRRAILSMNLSGGGGFEIWQYTSRTPQNGAQPRFGDLGHFAARIKCAHLEKAHKEMAAIPGVEVSPIQTRPDDAGHFWVTDQWGNAFDVVPGADWFHLNGSPNGGVVGATIGVSDMEASLSFYRDILALDRIVYDTSSNFGDTPVGAREEEFRRVLLSKSPNPNGAFSRLLGGIEIELVQCLSRTPQKIYGERFWGDPGFIHLCFDVLDMDCLKEHSEKAGYPFTIDSQNSFEMDKASGRYCYVEDPDGTLIELVETHKVPILKKLGWYLDLRKRQNKGPLADWKVQLLGLSKVK